MTRLFLLLCGASLCLTHPLLAQGIQGPASSTGNLGTPSLSMDNVVAPVVEAVANTLEEQQAENTAATNADSSKRCVATCYNTKDAKAGCDVPPRCEKIEKDTNYFSNIDKACKLPAGTAIKFGDIESKCNANAKNDFGYTGMFQFDKNSCKRGNLYDLNVQAACMCDYVNNTRAQYKRQNGQGEPSAGMYYLFHQQGGGCAMKLAYGGRQSAAAVIQQCGKTSANTALKRVACNLPGGCKQNMGRAGSITAQDFANLYLSKFNGIDNTNICAGGSLPATPSTSDIAGMQNIIQQQMAQNPFLSQFVNASGGSNFMANLIANSGNLTSNGQPMNILDVLRVIGMEDTSSIYDDEAGKGYETDEDEDVSNDTISFDITSNDDGSKTVKVTTNSTSRTHKVNIGYRMYVCDVTSINVVKIDSARDEDLATDTDCRKVTESLDDEDEAN